ncbi:hypothetical protein L207DRAFT_532659 [Hyaloscypha variabilis F]|uniref:DUF7702 domain-containing protein n=1 Tax=Hyaloscypha variabilis (strain UAMH 11265 / GT02V1 / F) TaxID=1149755 RepID=A0A2J6RF17_HYAVF|nr:hypothetical protein L207DRAFT_532659 [Hyaloscypha variabilis F]
MTFDYRSSVSIGELCIYSSALIIGIFLAARPGFGRNWGWFYLILFCLARIIGPAMQLSTLHGSPRASIYEGYAILNNVAISPLELVILGTLNRLLDSIHKTYNTFLRTFMLQIIQVVVVLGLILGVVGGVRAGNSFEEGNASGQHVFHPGPLGKAGSILLISCYVAIVIITALLSIFKSHLEAGETRLLLAVVLSLPFLLVRLIYTGFSTFSYNPKFNILDGDTTIFLCVALIEELIIVIIFEVTWLTLRRQVKEQHNKARRQIDSSNGSDPTQPKRGKSTGQIALGFAKATIFGHLVMLFVNRSHARSGVEMQARRA